MRSRIHTVAVTLYLLLCSTWVAADHHSPAQSKDASNLQDIGSPTRFLSGDQQVAAFRNMSLLAPTREISAGDYVLELPSNPRDLDLVDVRLGSKRMTVDTYMKTQRIAGLIVLKDREVVYERYGLGNTQDRLWISFSVAKSVVSMMVGMAIKDGYIDSVDQKVADFLPKLKGSSYENVTIKNLLQMSSGVSWNEDYTDPESDVASANFETLELYDHLRGLPVVAKPDTVFNYNTAETNLVGTLLRAAIGNNLSTYLTEKVWRPFGMEQDASWLLTEEGGGEHGGCCINAVLRDYARLGLFALAQGKLLDGTETLPKNWMLDSTTPSEASRGYGYLWWLEGGKTYQASGIFGQVIYIDPERNVVIAMQSAWEAADNDANWDFQAALMKALARATDD